MPGKSVDTHPVQIPDPELRDPVLHPGFVECLHGDQIEDNESVLLRENPVDVTRFKI